MKNLKLAFIFLFILGTSVTSLSQNEGTESFASILASLDIDLIKEQQLKEIEATIYELPEFRGEGKFLEVIKDPVLWKKLITQKDGEYIFMTGPGIDWILYNSKGEIATESDPDIFFNEVMIKSTVDSYYENILKNLEYDRYEYEVRTHDDGTVQEFYTLFKNGETYKIGIYGELNRIVSIGFGDGWWEK